MIAVPCLRAVAAPNAFKGSLPAPAAAAAICAGVRDACPDAVTTSVPMADGGDGTAETLAAALGGRRLAVAGPWPPRVLAHVVHLPDGTGVVDIASASGLGKGRPTAAAALAATSGATGLLVRRALDTGARRLWIALGGSATTDGGTGLLAALGARWLDGDGVELPPGGAALARLARVDLSGLGWLRETPFTLLVDVANPLLGGQGAAAAFAPQKGADAAGTAALEAGLGRLALVLEAAVGRRLRDLPGAGAAGGAGFGLAAALGAEIRPGAEVVAEATDLLGHLRGADLCFTGEGALDAQTALGKAPAVVGQRAAAAGVPAIALAGALGPGWEALLRPAGPLTAALPLAPGPRSRREALAATAIDLRRTAATAVRLFRSGRA